jgi:2-polyprenylphenol 6-hydroxylase
MVNAQKRSVLIAGAGPVGLTLAALLATGDAAEQLKIQVLDSRREPLWDPAQMDLRVYALSRASQQILEFLDVWKEISSRRACPYRKMHVWEGEFAAQLGGLSFDSADLGEPDLGHIVEDQLLRDQLFRTLQSADNVELRLGVELAAVRPDLRTVVTELRDAETFRNTLLVAADGGASTVRQLLDIPVTSRSYGQHAVVTNVRTERPHQETAWQRFLPGGPIALLPLLDGRSSVVWSMQSEIAEKLSAMTEQDFSAELERASGGVLGAIQSDEERAGFPLQILHAQRYCTERVALVGDAAHTVHPLAGQGMNLGLLDAASLAETVTAATLAGEDPGDLRVLRRYERHRKGRNLRAMLTMDALHRLFQLPGPLFGPLRAAGLSAVNASAITKRRLMREALGMMEGLSNTSRVEGVQSASREAQ